MSPRGDGRALGAWGERRVARRLWWRGYRIVGRNVSLGRFEIDLVARKGDTVAFVEVKTRRPSDVGRPEDGITPAKIQHLRQAARRYIAASGEDGVNYRFDVACVTAPETGKPAIDYFERAFPAE